MWRLYSGGVPLLWKPDRQVDFDPVHLPEFGLEVSWVMCRNPLCENFGKLFRGSIPEEYRQVTDENYVVSIVSSSKTDNLPYGQMKCQRCLQTSKLHSNRAIRAVARYYLSQSLPFADCSNPDCPNHGLNVFEHWTAAGKGRKRPYRRQSGKHQVCCVPCKEKHDRLTREAKRSARMAGESPYITLGEARGWKEDDRLTKGRWKEIINGVRTRRSVNDSYEIIDGITMGGYYAQLKAIGARLRDYQSFRNARLLRRDPHLRHDRTIRTYTDVLIISLKAFEEDQHFQHLRYVITAVPVHGTIFVLAAHPNFLPHKFIHPKRRCAGR